MIERCVFVRLDDEHNTPEGRSRVAASAKQELGALEEVRSLSVGLPADDHARAAWDLSIVLRFDDPEAVERYRVHPRHRAWVDGYLSPRMKVIKAWNFEVL